MHRCPQHPPGRTCTPSPSVSLVTSHAGTHLCVSAGAGHTSSGRSLPKCALCWVFGEVPTMHIVVPWDLLSELQCSSEKVPVVLFRTHYHTCWISRAPRASRQPQQPGFTLAVNARARQHFLTLRLPISCSVFAGTNFLFIYWNHLWFHQSLAAIGTTAEDICKHSSVLLGKMWLPGLGFGTDRLPSCSQRETWNFHVNPHSSRHPQPAQGAGSPCAELTPRAQPWGSSQPPWVAHKLWDQPHSAQPSCCVPDGAIPKCGVCPWPSSAHHPGKPCRLALWRARPIHRPFPGLLYMSVPLTFLPV